MELMYFILLLLIFLIYYVSSIKISSVALTYNERGDLFERITKDFNEYAKENNIDIELEVSLYTTANTTDFVNEYGSTLDHLLNKGSKKYDLYFYDVMYSKKYSNHFIDLGEALKRDHIKLYSNGVAEKTCKNGDKWVGLPLFINYSILHINKKLLDEYGKEIPKTWDQLLDVGKVIFKSEIEKGNSELIGYNGLIPDDESCICSIQEFIYSFRDNINSSFPGYNSDIAVEALNKLKEIKEELSTNYVFQSNDQFNINAILKGNALYLKYWYFPYGSKDYIKDVLLGKNEGVSGSTIGGYNIGVSKYIDDQNRKAAINALNFFTSLDYQRNFTIREKFFSGIDSLYDEEEVCQSVDCDLAKKFQPIARPNPLTEDYDAYSKEFRKRIFEFLYGDKSAKEVLREIDDLTRIYTISYDTSETYVGFIMFIVVSVIIIIMLFSLVFLLFSKFEIHLGFISKDFWLITIFGCILYLIFIFTEYGEVTSLKCQSRIIIYSFSFTFTVVPTTYRIIRNFPKKNIFFNLIENNKYIFLLFFMIIDVVFNELLFLKRYEAKIIIVENGKNFKSCIHNNSSGMVILIILIVIKFIILLFLALLIFMEWNMRATIRNVRLSMVIVYANCILYIMTFIINFTNVKNYELQFILHTISIILLSLSNFIIIYVVRLLWIFRKRSDPRELLRRFSTTTSTVTQSNATVNSSFSNSSVISTIMKFHYYTGGKMGHKSQIYTNKSNAGRSMSIQGSNSMDSRSFSQPSDVRKNVVNHSNGSNNALNPATLSPLAQNISQV